MGRGFVVALALVAAGIAAGIVLIVVNSSHARHRLCSEEAKTRGVLRSLLTDAQQATLDQLPPAAREQARADAKRKHPRTQAGQGVAFFNRNLARIDALTC